MPNSIDQSADIEMDLAELSQAPIQQLRLRWSAAFRTEPPAAFGPDLLRRSIAQKVQEQRYGGLSATGAAATQPNRQCDSEEAQRPN